MSLTFFILAGVGVSLWFVLLVMANASHDKSEGRGLEQGRLTRCGSAPNCVCSEFPDDPGHFIDPLSYGAITVTEQPITTMEFVAPLITQLGGQVTLNEPDYVLAEFESHLLGFVDDVELRLDREARQLHFRSASRSGYSDLGVNRRRIMKLKDLLTARAS